MTTISVDQLEEVDWSICVPSKHRDTTENTLDELLNILDAADKFGMVDLHSKVQRHIMLHGEGFIYKKNALEIQNIANEINATLLESYCDKSLNPSSLMTIPMEMRMNIFRFCTITSVLRVLRTCKYLNGEINSYWWKSQLKTRFNPSDWPLTYKAVKNIWGLSQDVSKLGYASLHMPGLCGIPGFSTVDTPSDEPCIPSGMAVYYPHITGPDPFIQGILTDGQDILVGYRSSGSVALAMLNCTTNPLQIAKFKPSKLKDCRWPRDITNAALHSGLVLLQHDGCIDLFSVKYDQQAPKRVRTYNYFASAMSINRNYYFFCVGTSVLMYDRDSHTHIMDLTGMGSSAVDLIIRNDKVMALTESKGIYIWDISSHKAPSLKVLTRPEGHSVLIIGQEHDNLGWARRKEIISNSDTSGLVLAGYLGFYASFGEFKHLDSLHHNARETIMQLDMEGRFIGKVCLANPNFTIQNAKTLDTVKDAINLRNSSELGTFLGFTLNSRVIVCFFTSGIHMISSTPRDGEIQRAVDDVFLNNSSSRIARVKHPDWPEADYY
ncbi:hypothetical protein V501_03339 [Pseudogymnoascus sp. VKM F-4519 (FW-2642)]|nr:hypothetical protein V501_03339 [Pseudogymnoascus sp. VKM F-4519 (FW-2642)]